MMTLKNITYQVALFLLAYAFYRIDFTSEMVVSALVSGGGFLAYFMGLGMIACISIGLIKSIFS